ncbi:acyltransferase family protein [uncultured Sphingomonas sp.]|uniref:acyltransferase family protein n=1 Tax=uncultured Sphingomonas sp. TaxID=158754 RepID=UPI0035CC6ABC
MTSRGELRALTSVRGIAAWLVVLYHIRRSIAGLPDTWLAVFARGYLAVDFFFLLSGFVIWLAWHDRLRRDGWRAAPAFLRKRIARIWPLHLAMLAAAFILAIALAAARHHDPRVFPFGELPLHVLLLQNWGFTDRLAWNDPAWSISCELAAYLAFPLLVRAIDWRTVPSTVLVVVGLCFLVLLHDRMANAGATSLGDDITRFGLARCLAEFGTGTIVGALWLRWRERPWWPFAGGVGVATAMVAGSGCGILPETLAFPIAFAAILLAVALTSGMAQNPLDWRTIHYLGETSYATYLAHFLLFFVFKLAFVEDAHAVPPPLITLYLAMVLSASVALHHLVERPAQAWVNRLRPTRATGPIKPPPTVPQALR